jgi:hypothetical protein
VNRLAFLAALLCLAPHVAAAQAPAPQMGVYAAQRVNAQRLPMTDEVIGDDGFTNAVRLHDMTIRLRPNGRFVATLSYRRAILTKGEKIETARLQNETWQGAYTRSGAALRFVPDKNGERKVEPFNGSVTASGRINVAFIYNIVKRKRYEIDLLRDPNIW